MLAQWGAGEFLMPHMITVDKHGHVWTVDVAAHTATKWSAKGKRLLQLGVPGEPGSGAGHLCKPTQVGLQGLGF